MAAIPDRPPLDDVIFPGGVPSRTVRKQREDPQAPVEEKRWDSNPQKRLLNDGREVELFPVGSLAMALDRSVKAIYKWERQRVFPPARYRTRAPARSTIPDKAAAGRRLYSREQIEAAVKAAYQVGLLPRTSPAPKVDWVRFTSLVVRAWKALG